MARTARTKAKSPAASNELPSAEVVEQLYRDMLLIRRFEERAGQMYGMGLIGGFCHLYIGQEAVVVGMQTVVRKGDSIITGYRDHGHMLACGMDSNGVMAELTGREGGYSRGKGGSMHMFSKEKGFYGGHGIVGGQVSLGVGLGFAHKYRGDGGCSFAYYGDGASNQGQVFESYNLASLWKLPVVFVIENNQYGMGTAVTRSAAGESLFERGKGFGIPGKKIDGMDITTVMREAAEATAYARENGPFILEMETYRYRGHSMSDPAKYRSRDEVTKMREERDPIESFRARIQKAGLMEEESFKAIDQEVRAVVAEAAEFAQQSPEPDAAELYTDILLDA